MRANPAAHARRTIHYEVSARVPTSSSSPEGTTATPPIPARP